MQRYLLMVLVASCYLTGHRVDAGELTAQEAIELFRVATSSIRSFDVVVDVVDEPLAKEEVVGYREPSGNDVRRHPIIKFRPYREGEPRSSPKKQKYRQAFQGNDGRIETIDPDTGVVKRVLAGKGDVWKTKQPGGTTAAIQEMPLQPIPDGANYLTLTRNAIGQADFLTVLQQRRNLRISSESGNGPNRFVIIDAPPDQESNLNRYGFVVKLDRDHGFMPCQIDVYSLERGTQVTTRKTIVDSFLKLPGDAWAPIQATTTIFDRQSISEPLALDKRITIVDKSKSSWNGVIPEQMFDVEIPRGTIVRDMRKNATYVEGQPDTEKNLVGLAQEGKHIVEQMPPSYSLSESHLSWYLAAAAAAVGLFALGIWMRRGPSE